MRNVCSTRDTSTSATSLVSTRCCAVLAPRGILVPFQLHCWKALRPVARRNLNFYAHGGRLGPRDFDAFQRCDGWRLKVPCLVISRRDGLHARTQDCKLTPAIKKDDHRAQTYSKNPGSDFFAKPLRKRLVTAKAELCSHRVGAPCAAKCRLCELSLPSPSPEQ